MSTTFAKTSKKVKRESRKWRVHVWIILPSIVPMKEGKFPKKWRTIDIFPETKLFKGKRKVKIWLRKNRHKNRKQSNYLLETKILAKSPTEALEFLGDKIEVVLDMLAFQLQSPIPVTYVEAIDFTEPLKEGEERECAFANSYPRVQKDSGFRFFDNWAITINSKLIMQKLDISTEAALRWFAKGISAHAIVDQFTSFWIALEIIVPALKPRSKRFFQCRKCGYQIKTCPKCSYSTEHWPEIKEKIESFIADDLKRDKTLFEKLWNTRMIFHGRNKLTPEEIKVIPEMTWELRMILIDAIKMKLGLSLKDKPYLRSVGGSIMDKFYLGGRRKLTALDLKSKLS